MFFNSHLALQMFAEAKVSDAPMALLWIVVALLNSFAAGINFAEGRHGRAMFQGVLVAINVYLAAVYMGIFT